MRGYVHQALSRFGIDTSEPPSQLGENYVEVPVQATHYEWDKGDRGRMVESPLLYVADPTPDGIASLAPPFLAMLIGTSGVGKTEMVRQLYRHTALLPGNPIDLLPVSLVQCSWRGTHQPFPPQPPPQNEFRDFLFTPLIEQSSGLVGELVDRVVLEDIHSGAVMLALDGLDEIATGRGQHDAFFHSLFDLLKWRDRGRKSAARILISGRVEYLSALGIKDGNDLTGVAGGGKFTMPVYFLRLDFFADSRIKAYLRRRRAYEQFGNFLHVKPGAGPGQISDMLRRPLFLKLLCDLADASGDDCITSINTPTEVLNNLVNRTVSKTRLFWSWVWDNDRLATMALALYKTGRTSFRRDEILAFIEPSDGDVQTGATPPDPFQAIHKCPFLRRDGDELRFTHQIFLDYFVALGMYVDRLRSEDKGPADASDFDRYVLTVEMRRFLRDLMGEPAWRERTRRTYALDDLESWPDPEWAIENELQLETIRNKLLTCMTDSVAIGDAESDIEQFMELKPEKLHPSYRSYNYEAIAVYLWDHRWKESERKLEHRFDARLRSELETALGTLSKLSAGDPARDAWERLVLRTLSAAYRLRLSSVLRYAGRKDRFQHISGPDTKANIERITKPLSS